MKRCSFTRLGFQGTWAPVLKLVDTGVMMVSTLLHCESGRESGQYGIYCLSSEPLRLSDAIYVSLSHPTHFELCEGLKGGSTFLEIEVYLVPRRGTIPLFSKQQYTLCLRGLKETDPPK